MATRQVTAHVTPAIHERFRRYAERLGMKDSEVAKLLILRERNLQRLKAAVEELDVPKRQKRGKAKILPTITAHMTADEHVKDFHNHAVACRLSRSAAAAILINKEIEERWLERSIAKP